MYYDADCLKKIEILFLLIWILISKYFGIILDKKYKFVQNRPKKMTKKHFFSQNETLLKSTESGLQENVDHRQNNGLKSHILRCMDAKLIFLIKIRLEKMCSRIVFIEISFLWFFRQSVAKYLCHFARKHAETKKNVLHKVP